MEETYEDEIGRLFCDKHRREICHECCFDFEPMNRDREEDAGLRAPKTELEIAAEDLVVANSSLQAARKEFGWSNLRPGENPAYDHLMENQVTKQEEWNTYIRDNNVSLLDANAAMRKALEKEHKSKMELEAVKQAWAKENPGKRVMEYGGPDTQRLYDQVASAPVLSAKNKDRVDLHTCSYCGKASVEILSECERCRHACYCNRDCQVKAWKAHKSVCVRVKEEPKSLKIITWKQVEAHEGLPVEKKTLEVRAIVNESLTRQVFSCKDREGTVHRVAAYTNSRSIPGLEQGAILRWKNPRFHYFMDGSAGARIEEEDLENIKIISD